MRSFTYVHAVIIAAILLSTVGLFAEDVDTKFHNAPASVRDARNPFAKSEAARAAGQKLYAANCASCHGRRGQGTGNVPSLVDGRLDSVTPGELFWFITKGSKENGMPSWSAMQVTKRWQIVTYIKLMKASNPSTEASTPPPADTTTSKLKAPAPTAPFTDFRYEKPGTVRKIAGKDLPQPY